MGAHHARHLAALGHEVAVVDPALGRDDDVSTSQAVVVATPTPTHAAVALPWLRRGIPVLVEKPLAGDLDAARALAEFPQLAVGHVERWNPALHALRTVEPRFMAFERTAPWSDRSPGIDVVLDLMVHDLDLFLAVDTDDPVAEVRANGMSVATAQPDIVHARVETRSGRVGTFVASRVSRRVTRTARAFAEGGYWSLDLRAGTATHVGKDLVEAAVAVPAHDALREELRSFLAAAAGTGRFPVSGAEAVATLELADAVRCRCT
jgi:predicted dehydrogenase